MAKFDNIEDSPHHLKLLSDYGKTAVTLSLALLSLSVAFAEKFLRSPLDLFQAIVLVLLWICLFLALICGIMITARLTAVASNYLRGVQIAYPDALTVLGQGDDVNVPTGESESIKAPCKQQQAEIRDALMKSDNRAIAANWWANRSFVMFCVSAGLICVLGFYSSIYRGMQDIGEGTAIKSAVQSVMTLYKLPQDDAQLDSLGYDEKGKIYVIKIKSKKAPGDAYIITIDGVSGRVTNATKSP